MHYPYVLLHFYQAIYTEKGYYLQVIRLLLMGDIITTYR